MSNYNSANFGSALHNEFKFYQMTPTHNHTLVTATPVPASGSFIDVTGADRIDIIAWYTIGGADDWTLEPRIADSISGTLDPVNATEDIKDPSVVADSNKMTSWAIEGRDLPEGHSFLAVVPVGTVAATTAVILALVSYVNSNIPVIQDEAVLPKAKQYILAAGQVYQPS